MSKTIDTRIEILSLIPADVRAFHGWVQEGSFLYEEAIVIGWAVTRTVVRERSDDGGWSYKRDRDYYGDEIQLHVMFDRMEEPLFELDGNALIVHRHQDVEKELREWVKERQEIIDSAKRRKEREQQAIKLRAEGRSFEEIASTLGGEATAEKIRRYFEQQEASRGQEHAA